MNGQPGPELRAATDSAFAILTACHHGMPELVGLIEGLGYQEALLVIWTLANLMSGMCVSLEVRGGMERGDILPIMRLRLDA